MNNGTIRSIHAKKIMEIFHQDTTDAHKEIYIANYLDGVVGELDADEEKLATEICDEFEKNIHNFIEKMAKIAVKRARKGHWKGLPR